MKKIKEWVYQNFKYFVYILLIILYVLNFFCYVLLYNVNKNSKDADIFIQKKIDTLQSNQERLLNGQRKTLTNQDSIKKLLDGK
jgi:predicted negative regulator of RcsB-dependent stress response